MRRYLVVVRADHDSRHPDWVRGGQDRNFDLLVSYFGSRPHDFERDADYFEAVPGMKWPRLHELYVERREWFLAYDAYWFADDDISARPQTICQMFDLFTAHDLWVAQPALGSGSYVGLPITRRVIRSKLRFTSYVEVMAPLFSRYALERLVHTFADNVSGWGLDHAWWYLMGEPRKRFAVLDATPVVHTRPFGAGRNYATCTELGVDWNAEFKQTLERYGVPRPRYDTFESIWLGHGRPRPKHARRRSRHGVTTRRTW